MKAFIPKIDFKNDLPNGRSIYFKAEMVYILPDPIVIILDAKFRQSELKPEKYYTVMQAEHLIRPYDAREDNSKNIPVIVRSGGIGDLIALSTLTYYLQDKTDTPPIFICDGRFKDVFSWYWYSPKRVIDHFEPLCPYMVSNGNTKNLRIISMENICEENPRKNWYEKFYERINAPFEPKFGRPFLFGSLSQLPNTMVIVNKASSFMRSIDLDLLLPIVTKLFPEYRIILLNKYFLSEPYKNVSFFFPPSIFKFLDILFRASHIISVDTAGIHFFEGNCKPGLGLYSSFTTESRTKYYTYTKSVDIQSTCDLQPCFLHDKKTGDQCPKMLPGENTAPCMGRLSTNITEQLTEYLNLWKKTF